MCSGYLLLSIPILSTSENISWLLPMTCFALFLIAFGNGLFKGNLQAIVGQLYDNPKYASKRDSGFQIFYVFINVGGLIAPLSPPCSAAGGSVSTISPTMPNSPRSAMNI